MNAQSLRRTVVITNPQGLHMRPMQAFVETANRYRCQVKVSRDGMEPIDGKSMIMLLGLAAEQGTCLLLEADGPDAAEALDALVEVLERSADD